MRTVPAQDFLSADRMLRWFDDTVAPLRERCSVPGLQLGVLTGTTTFECSSGVTAVDGGPEVTSHTLFRVGSITKAFTATLVLALAEDGLVALDEPVATYLPELAEAAPHCADITLRHLLLHTSGLVDDDQQRWADAGTLGMLLDRLATTPLRSRPGERFAYASTGFLLAGHVVEAVCGTSWYSALAARVLRPLDVPAALAPLEMASGRIAEGHGVGPGGEPVQVPGGLRISMASAGGLATSAGGLLNLARAYLRPASTGGLLSEAAVRRALVVRQTLPDHEIADEWALGWARLRGEDGSWWFGHDGNFDGGMCFLRFRPEQDLALTLLTNSTAGASLWLELIRLLEREIGTSIGNTTWS